MTTLTKRIEKMLGVTPDSVTKEGNWTLAQFPNRTVYIRNSQIQFEINNGEMLLGCSRLTLDTRHKFTQVFETCFPGFFIPPVHPRSRSLRAHYGSFHIAPASGSTAPIPCVWLPRVRFRAAYNTVQVNYEAVPAILINLLRSFAPEFVAAGDWDTYWQINQVLGVVHSRRLLSAFVAPCPYCRAKLVHPMHTLYHTHHQVLSPELMTYFGFTPEQIKTLRWRPNTDVIWDHMGQETVKPAHRKILLGDWSKVF